MLKSSTVTVEGINKIKNGYEIFTCTGIIIHDDEKTTGILTAQHCVENVDRVIIDKRYDVVSVQASKTIDVAYLVIDNVIMHKNSVKLARYNVSMNQLAYSLSYTSTEEIFNCGRVISIGKKSYVTDKPIKVGCSGSGVINVRGKLIGVIWGGYSLNGKEISSIITNIKPIRDFLKSINFLKETSILVK